MDEVRKRSRLRNEQKEKIERTGIKEDGGERGKEEKGKSRQKEVEDRGGWQWRAFIGNRCQQFPPLSPIKPKVSDCARHASRAKHPRIAMP